MGVKTGLPYVWRVKKVDALTNLKYGRPLIGCHLPETPAPFFALRVAVPWIRTIWCSVLAKHVWNRKEYKGLFWQEELVPFFHGLQLPAEATTVEACYLEIAKQVSFPTH